MAELCTQEGPLLAVGGGGVPRDCASRGLLQRVAIGPCYVHGLILVSEAQEGGASPGSIPLCILRVALESCSACTGCLAVHVERAGEAWAPWSLPCVLSGAGSSEEPPMCTVCPSLGLCVDPISTFTPLNLLSAPDSLPPPLLTRQPPPSWSPVPDDALSRSPVLFRTQPLSSRRGLGLGQEAGRSGGLHGA